MTARWHVEAGGEARYLPPLIRYFGPDVLCEDISRRIQTTCGSAITVASCASQKSRWKPLSPNFDDAVTRAM